ncbi:MAG: hypothetical protein O9295_12720 [Microcystis sp. LE18-22.4A]|uniref:Uncharacterized protein n=2 Tax=Microcystis TaxID=1125 RepID=A0A510PMR0_MICAE|nr:MULTISPECIES: hypothetical protein [Microcystis]MBD2620840.1 hypothetical protein [Microcystis flos-aquae FACHB-1344]MCA2698893.1 hypothetical protein [Microcystis sp. M179S2]MCZ8118888.1 hypothetical protein [Microcystis sp. LE18-22.4A]MDJ0672977.1 hypothetical protein [Microcystis sp. M53598_WE2]GCA94870.1 hypothetical protein MAE30S32_35220 [Microcystis aeruginosa 11-30S32]
MNASEQAKGLELTAKIATLVNLFKQEFPDAKADLKPWRNDPHTRELTDPDSIDIAFHFPGWSPRIQGRSILVQIRFHLDSEDQHQRLIGLEMQAFNHQGTAWRLSTVENWQLVGNYQPSPKVADKLKYFSRQVFEVFKNEHR